MDWVSIEDWYSDEEQSVSDTVRTNEEVQPDSTPPRSVCLALPSFVIAVLDGAALRLTASHPCTVSPVPPSVIVAAPELGAPPQTPLSHQFTAAITSTPRPFPLVSSSASLPDQPVTTAAPSITQVPPSAIHPSTSENRALWWARIASTAVRSASLAPTGVASPGTIVQLSAYLPSGPANTDGTLVTTGTLASNPVSYQSSHPRRRKQRAPGP